MSIDCNTERTDPFPLVRPWVFGAFRTVTDDRQLHSPARWTKITEMARPTLLLPVIFPKPELHPIAESSIEGLDGFDIVLFGYWKVPEDTPAATIRERHQTEAEAVLYEMAAKFSRAGASTEIQLHFGPEGADDRELQNRISDETDPDTVLIADSLTSIHNILVPMRDDRHAEQIVDFVTSFHTDDIFVIELYHATPDQATVDSATEMLEAVAETLLDRGFSEADIETTVVVAGDTIAAIAAKAQDHNVVVMGQSAGENRLFSPTAEYIDENTETPIAVIRH